MVQKLYAAIHADGHVFVADHEQFPPGPLTAQQIAYPLAMVTVKIGSGVTVQQVTDYTQYPQLSTLSDFKLLRAVAPTVSSKRSPPRHLALFIEVDAQPDPSTIQRLNQALREPMLTKDATMMDLMYLHR
jgi:hypothetical protein